MYVDPNKAESAREEVEEKIRGKRKPAWGRLREGGRVVNTSWRASEEESTESLLLDGKLDSREWMCHEMERTLSKGERNRNMPSPAP